jgi:hypothetical protein
MAFLNKKSDLISSRNSNIYTNSNNEITATKVNTFLDDFIDSVYERLSGKVAKKNDLTTINIDPVVGMMVAVYDDNTDNGVYILKQAPHTTLTNWFKDSSTSSQPSAPPDSIQFNNAGSFGGSRMYYSDTLKTFSINSLPTADVTLSITSKDLYDSTHKLVSIGAAMDDNPSGGIFEQREIFTFELDDYISMLKIKDSLINSSVVGYGVIGENISYVEARGMLLSGVDTIVPPIITPFVVSRFFNNANSYVDGRPNGIYVYHGNGGDYKWKSVMVRDEYDTLTNSSGNVNWNTLTGLNKEFSGGGTFNLVITNIVNGMKGDVRLNITSTANITLNTGKTNLGIGSLSNIPIGVHHLIWSSTASNLEWELKTYS